MERIIKFVIWCRIYHDTIEFVTSIALQLMGIVGLSLIVVLEPKSFTPFMVIGVLCAGAIVLGYRTTHKGRNR